MDQSIKVYTMIFIGFLYAANPMFNNLAGRWDMAEQLLSFIFIVFQ